LIELLNVMHLSNSSSGGWSEQNICQSMEETIADLESMSISAVTESCLEAFYPFVKKLFLILTSKLAEKKVISVEMMESSMQQYLSAQK
jgi:hypothetical protein